MKCTKRKLNRRSKINRRMYLEKVVKWNSFANGRVTLIKMHVPFYCCTLPKPNRAKPNQTKTNQTEPNRSILNWANRRPWQLPWRTVLSTFFVPDFSFILTMTNLSHFYARRTLVSGYLCCMREKVRFLSANII